MANNMILVMAKGDDPDDPVLLWKSAFGNISEIRQLFESALIPSFIIVSGYELTDGPPRIADFAATAGAEDYVSEVWAVRH